MNGKEVNLTGDYAIYDMATAFLGPNWRMPTKDEYVALCASYTWGGNNSLNANSVVFPAAGYWNGGSFSYGGSSGFYWSSSCYNGGRAYRLLFSCHSSLVSPGSNRYRYSGQSVRPVQD